MINTSVWLPIWGSLESFHVKWTNFGDRPHSTISDFAEILHEYSQAYWRNFCKILASNVQYIGSTVALNVEVGIVVMMFTPNKCPFLTDYCHRSRLVRTVETNTYIQLLALSRKITSAGQVRGENE